MKNDSRKTAAHANQETPAAALVRFNFHGDELDVAHLQNGEVGVSLRRLCEALPVDFASQAKRLAREARNGARWATVVKLTTVAEDGKPRAMLVLPRRSIPMFAATISLGSVREDMRPGVTAKLALYQDECSDVLADHFLGARSRETLRLLSEQTEANKALLGQQHALIVAQSRDLDIVRAENRTLREQQTNGTITGMAADWIREQITVVAPMMAMLGWCPRKQTVRAARRVLQNGIAQAAGWGHERGQEIADMPTTGYPHARAYLKAKRESAEAEIAKRARDTKAAADAIMLARQGSLFAEPGANQNAGRAVS